MIWSKYLGDDSHEHCWHIFGGPIWMVVPDGHVVEECCHCHQHRTIHIEHRHHRPLDLSRWLVNGVERRHIY